MLLTQQVAGRRVRGHCRAGARHGVRCTVTVRRARFTRHGRAGTNTFRLSLTKLRAGRYTVDIAAVNAAHHRSQTAGFTLSLR